MEFFKTNTKIQFMAQRWKCAVLSAVLFVASIVSLSVYGLNFGLEFTGGTQIQLAFPQTANVNAIRTKLDTSAFKEAVVQNYGSPNDVLIKLAPSKKATNMRTMEQQTSQEIGALFPKATIQQINYIGPVVGQELATKGILAIIVAMIAIMVYVGLRFEFRFAVSSTLALIHDPILILGVFSFWHIQFDLVTLAAVLTVIGYSLNDTIVVFDRVRENFRKIRKGTPIEIMDISINQTLSRTIMTSLLTFLAVIALFLFGGPVLHGFSLAFLIGIAVGTYSSIYVAGALALAFGLKREDLLPKKRYVDDRP